MGTFVRNTNSHTGCEGEAAGVGMNASQPSVCVADGGVALDVGEASWQPCVSH